MIARDRHDEHDPGPAKNSRGTNCRRLHAIDAQDGADEQAAEDDADGDLQDEVACLGRALLPLPFLGNEHEPPHVGHFVAGDLDCHAQLALGKRRQRRVHERERPVSARFQLRRPRGDFSA